MRILQLIDSLELGGAEKMAITFANSLHHRIAFSGLVTTRKEGALKCQLDTRCAYFFLNKKSSVDLGALLRLRRYCRKNNIQIIQAHGSSFFFAFLLKLVLPSIDIVWHNHNGQIASLAKRNLWGLKISSLFFKRVIAVNKELKDWSFRELHCKNVLELSNFAAADNTKQLTELLGQQNKRIVCVANLRLPKNHLLLVEVAKRIKSMYPDWSFHLIGKDYQDTYSEMIKSEIAEARLQDNVFIYGTKDDMQYIISQSEIAILTSQAEGLPVALLEYGLSRKPVVVTAVGELPQIIMNGENGFIVPKDDIDGFCNSLIRLIESESLRLKMGNALAKTVHENHSEEAVINKLIYWLGND